MKVVVVDYSSGNLASAARGLVVAGERAGLDDLASAARGLVVAGERAGLDVTVTVSADPAEVARADRIVLPGQGAFADCRHGLEAIPGMCAAITDATDRGAPFLGICVGMQLMAKRGLEHEVTQGFGWVDGEIAVMNAAHLRLPQMGWNALDFRPGSHPLLEGLHPGDHAYFVHSYALQGSAPDQVLATTDYGGPVVAFVAHGNRAGTQFHVEKSQDVGLRILRNFLLWTP
jgi:glutamine amidotransferase